MKLVAKNQLVSVLVGNGKYMAIRVHGSKRHAHVGSHKYIRSVARRVYGVRFDETKVES